MEIKKYTGYFSVKSKGITATTSLRTKIPLKKLANLPKTEYNPIANPFLVMKFRKWIHRINVLIFSNGNLILIGAKNLSECHAVLEDILEILKSEKIQIKSQPKIVIQNISN